MLNDTRCKTAKPLVKPYKLTDDKGLYLEVKPNGVKAWRYRFKLSGKESIFSIGDYPAISLSTAREKRQEARELVKQEINPVHHRQLRKINRDSELATTFEAVALEWLALKDWQEITKSKRLALLKRVVFPLIGKLPIKQVSSPHILGILQKTAKTAPTVAAEAQRSISGIFDLAISTLRCDTNPVYPIRKALPANKTQHKRPLTSDEIGQVLRDLEEYQSNFQTVAVFKLMWFTLCRPNEAIEAKWSEFDLDAGIWRIPAERMKKRKEHMLPLPYQAVQVLLSIRGITGGRSHVFPHRDDHNRPMTGAALRQALKSLGWSGRFSPHAIRTTGSTKLNEMGFQSDWIERQLAHVEVNAVRRAYNHAEHLSGRTIMMQQWANLLEGIKGGAQVIPLTKNTPHNTLRNGK